eukprot:TRINITY_DN126_c1_g2_i1.p2 TRINITY_DN126_c1_g2~~TRINITY_DN126_c1_g2_i1.p2  ORF type:complete len:182 (-),score=38.66 TRINITY_DN126_c1_g2_i1:69-614(-)
MGPPFSETNWDQARLAVEFLAQKVVEADEDGVSLFFFSNNHHVYHNVTSSEQILQAFDRRRPNGTTDLAGALARIFTHIDRTTQTNGFKPCTIIIITDGVPDDALAVEQLIIHRTQSQLRDEDLSISFVQIGEDAAATEWLQHLDDNLMARGARFDIVDTRTAADMRGMSFAEFIWFSIND